MYGFNNDFYSISFNKPYYILGIIFIDQKTLLKEVENSRKKTKLSDEECIRNSFGKDIVFYSKLNDKC